MHVGEALGSMVVQWKFVLRRGLSSVCPPKANNLMSLTAAVLPSYRNGHLIDDNAEFGPTIGEMYRQQVGQGVTSPVVR
jgi:hypothetical protein